MTASRIYITPMQWIDEGIVLGVKRHGETSVILELMTQERGRHLGLVRGGSKFPPARDVCSRGIRCAPLGGRGSTITSATMRLKVSICERRDFSPPRMPCTA